MVKMFIIVTTITNACYFTSVEVVPYNHIDDCLAHAETFSKVVSSSGKHESTELTLYCKQ